MDNIQSTNRHVDNKDLKFVHRFLVEHNFENTADALMIEAAIKGFKNLEKETKLENEIYENYHEQLMMAYKTGNLRTFFKLWNLLVPENAKQTKACKILMLYLYVYFAMLPKRMLLPYWHKEKGKVQSDNGDPMQLQDLCNYEENCMTEIEKNMNENVEQLHLFLNTTGKELENDTELRPYFALPFIEDPYAEPFLSNVFENSWIDKLTEELQLFLKKYKPLAFSDAKYNNDNSSSKSSNYGSLSEAQRRNAKRNATKNVPIIPNDRNIPIFLEDEEESEEQHNACGSIKYSQKTKSIQTVSTKSSEEEIYSAHFAKKNKKLIQCTQELALAKSHLCSVHSNYEQSKARFLKLHADYHKLMRIARVLTSALENSAKGEVIDFQAILETCIKIFPDLFNQNIRDNSHCSSELLLDKSRSGMKDIEYFQPHSNSIPPKSLDFKKIKLHLINGSIKTKLFLLQALRRKITFSQAGERDETVHEYISKDLLGLHSQIASYRGRSILPYLLTPQNVTIPHPLQQSIARLLNALASFRCGRDYLSFDSTVVDMVFKCLNSISDNNVDTLTCNMMIAMLQKLSLRKQQRIYMIENGLVEWLTQHLHDQGRVMDCYRLEYATALLMNLSLHQTARKRASAIASLLISTLIDLLLMDHPTALQYINGSLSNFLTNHVINEEAKKMKFASILEQYSKYKTGEVREHLDHILQIHIGEVIVKTEDEKMTDNDNEEFDVLESQLEENDPVKNNYGELCGESLLESCYTILTKTIQRKEAIPKESCFAPFIPEMADSTVQDEVKDSTSESVPREEILPRNLANRRKHDMKNRSNIMVLQRDTIKKTISYPKSQSHVTKLSSTSNKDRQISKRQILNERTNWNENSSRDDKAYNGSAMYLYENHTSKDSSKTTVSSSMLLEIGSEAESTVMEKLSSIASLSISDNKWTEKADLETEEAFLARPKLSRTPP